MAEAEEVPETTQELSLVCPSDIAFCDSGEDVVLLCRLDPAVSAVSMEIKWKNKDDIVCYYKDGQVIESRDGRVSLSVDDLHSGNVSLTLRDVRRSQRGFYICEVIHRLQTLKEYIFLHISSEDFDLVVPTDPVTANPGDDVVLPVHLSPETSALCMEIRWFRDTDQIYMYRNGQEEKHSAYESRVSLSMLELERGNLSLTLRNVEQSDSGEYTCRVFHDGRLKRGKVNLQVTEFEMSENPWKYWPMPDLSRLAEIQTPIDLDSYLHENDFLQDSIKNIQDEKKKLDAILGPGSRLRHLERIDPFISEEEMNTLLKESVESQSEPLRRFSHSSPEVQEYFNRLLKALTEAQRQLVELRRHQRYSSHSMTEGLPLRRRNSTEGIRPLMQEESAGQQTEGNLQRQITSIMSSVRARTQAQYNAEATMQRPQERPESVATEQQRNPLDAQFWLLERERTSINAVTQIHQERRQENVTRTAVQSEVHERPESATEDRRQERPENRPQRQERPENRPPRQERPENRPRRQESPENRPQRQERPENRPPRQERPENRPPRQERPENRPRRQESPENRPQRQERPENRPPRQERPENRPTRQENNESNCQIL